MGAFFSTLRLIYKAITSPLLFQPRAPQLGPLRDVLAAHFVGHCSLGHLSALAG